MTGERLDGWKAVAAFLNRDERTVRRWEESRHLPVHRIPGGERGRVWADPAELRAWMARGGAEEDTAAAPVRPHSRKGWLTIAAALVLAVPLTAGAWLATHRPAQAEALPYARDPAARSLFLRGLFLWNARTPEGIAQAIPIFEELARRHPERPDAFAKLADCWLLQREFGTLSEPLAYARARAAAETALRADPRSPEGLRALAFVRFWADRDLRALDLFARAARADPQSAQSWLWYANALDADGRDAEAMKAYDAARALDPTNPAILADQALAMLYDGRGSEARAQLTQVVTAAPQMSSGHRYLALAALFDGDDATYLRESLAAAQLRHDRAAQEMIAAASRTRAREGRRAMLLQLADAREAEGGGGLMDAAMFRALAGDAAGARQRLAHVRSAHIVGRLLPAGFAPTLSRN